jgi:hypothetical protein
MVDSSARNVEKPLAMAGQQGNQQGAPAGVQVDGPGHRTVLGQRENVAYQLQELGLVVGHPAREHLRPVRVDHRAVMRDLARIRPRPELGHPSLPRRPVD